MRFNPISKTKKVFFAEITPIEAAEILEKHNTDPDTGESTNFRHLRESRADKYASDMKKRSWMPGIATIDFDIDGVLMNGQHTLRACETSGRIIEVTVRVGLPTEAVQVLDAGLSRRDSDALGVSGVFTAVGRWMYEASEWQHTLGRVQMLNYYEKQRAPIEFVLEHCAQGRGSKGVRIGPVLAPVARAWYSENRDKLERFLRLLSTGIPDDGIHMKDIFQHRNWIQEGAVRGDRRTQAYWRTEKVLYNFVNNRSVERVVIQPGEELFKIPGDKPKAIVA